MGIMDVVSYLPCDPANCGGAREKEDIRYLVYHYTGNDGDTAQANAKYYAQAKVKASAHYFVDDDSIFQSVGELTVAWAVGGKKWSDCDVTGGGKLYGVVTNANSISVELCDTSRDGEILPSEKTLRNAVELGKNIMARYGIPIGRVVRHFDVTGKYCPRYFMDEDKWAAFKARLTQEARKDVKRYDNMAEIRAAAPWAVPTVEKLIQRGALTGTTGWYDEDGNPTGLDLSEDMIRAFVVSDRAGAYDN